MAANSTLSKLLEDFVDNTTTHGLPRVLRADRPLLSRVFWGVITVGFFSILVWQGSQLVVDYCTWPSTTKISIVAKPELKFPAVTFCNLNMMRRSKLKDTRFKELVALDDMYQDIDNQELDYTWFFSDTSPTRRKRSTLSEQESPLSLSSSSDLFPDYFNWDVSGINAWREFYAKSRSGDFSDLQEQVKPTKEELQEYGHQAEDFILQCSFDFHPCNHTNFTMVQNSRYGNCYVFNGAHKLASKRAVRTSNTGPQYGLHVTLFVEQPEYVGVLTPESGVKVSVHHHSLFAFPEDDGITASTGQATNIGLKMLKITRLPSPHGDCTNQNTEQYDPTRYVYSQRSCSKVCYQMKVKERCGCVTDILVDGTTCSPTNVTCKTKVKLDFVRNKIDCQCPNPCRETIFQPTVSTALWPSEKYEEHLYYKIQNVSEKAAKLLSDVSTTRKNLVRVRVFFEQLNYQEVIETPLYTIEKLFGAVGGLMGLYIGMSFISLCEILVFIVDLVRALLCKLTPGHGLGNKVG